MAYTLDQWQEHLEEHFAGLSARRSASSAPPIFALEHGLSEANIDDIAIQLRKELQETGRPNKKHWLPWVIYATEHGYNSDGKEYWQTFEQETPGWEDRYQMARWFNQFHKSYETITPSGRWAEHFWIIASPITHAILPRFLRRQFLQTLFQLRHNLGRLDTFEPTAIGNMIASNAYYPSSRLARFLQQEELVGRITTAILNPEELNKQNELLLDSTLKRIVADLDEMESGGDWRKKTAGIFSERFKNIGRGLGPRPPATPNKEDDSRDKVRSSIRPDLKLRCKENGSWNLYLDIPSFGGLAALSPEMKDFLVSSRVIIGAGAPRPAGFLLDGRREVPLQEWPTPNKPLIEFEGHSQMVNFFRGMECRMDEGPRWLFRVAKDGVAREIKGKAIRPGNNYIVISSGEIADDIEGITSCSINCSGKCFAKLVKVPKTVPDEYDAWLKEHNFGIEKTIRVWPAGFPGRRWDGQGKSEWLTTEKPCIGIEADHRVESYDLCIDDGEVESVSADDSGKPIFLRLSELSEGRNILNIRARGKNLSTDDELSNKGHLELYVRKPEHWTQGTTSHSGLAVTVSPYDATLSEVWENEVVGVQILGPSGFQVTAEFTLLDAKEDRITCHTIFESLDLPVEPDKWINRFGAFLRSNPKGRSAYLGASSGVLTIDGGVLGKYTRRFERYIQPLRWEFSERDGKFALQLVDETGQERHLLECYFYEMEKPNEKVRIDPANALNGIPDDKTIGGLYFARSGNHSDAAIMSTGVRKGTDFKVLGVQPDLGKIFRKPEVVAELLESLARWDMAKMFFGLLTVRRHQVKAALIDRIIESIVGKEWVNIEGKLKDMEIPSTSIISDNLAVIESHTGTDGVAIRMSVLEGGKMQPDSFNRLLKKCGIAAQDELARFAFNLSFSPASLAGSYTINLPAMIEQCMNNPKIVCVARLVFLLEKYSNYSDLSAAIAKLEGRHD